VSYLLDSSAVIALAVGTHEFNEAAHRWFGASDFVFHTCPITQGALLRYLIQQKQVSVIASAWAVLQSIVEHPRHRFLPDSLGYHNVSHTGLLGHRQVTDAYLSALAEHHQLRLATFDTGLAALHRQTAILIPR
jgi:uncharacterized protein